MLDIIVIVALALLAIALFPIWPYNRGWGRGPTTVATALVVAFVLFWFIVPIF